MSVTTLAGGVAIRPVRPGDGAALARGYARNREHLAPWEPVRPESWFTAVGQEEQVARLLEGRDTGTTLPWLILDGDEAVGAMTVSGIVRGPFLSGNLGYWVDGALNGRGIATAAVAHVLAGCAAESLHRVQAATLVHNAASQTVLRRNGFDRIGLARRYLRIAGQWQDHLLFERILDED